MGMRGATTSSTYSLRRRRKDTCRLCESLQTLGRLSCQCVRGRNIGERSDRDEREKDSHDTSPSAWLDCHPRDRRGRCRQSAVPLNWGRALRKQSLQTPGFPRRTKAIGVSVPGRADTALGIAQSSHGVACERIECLHHTGLPMRAHGRTVGALRSLLVTSRSLHRFVTIPVGAYLVRAGLRAIPELECRGRESLGAASLP
jgi:hypothetical protein